MSDPVVMINIQTETDGDEAWAAVILDAPAGWTFEVPGRRAEESQQVELTLIRRTES